MFGLYFLLFLTIVTADSDCPGPSFSRIYFQRHYTTFPTEETLQVYLPPYDAQHLTVNEVYDGKSDVTIELCLVTEKKFVMRLMDSKNDGWGKGSYITVYTPNAIIYEGLYLASGGFAEVEFIIPPASSSSSTDAAILIFIIVFCFTFLIVTAIVSSIVRCAVEKKQKQMPVTQTPQVTMISGPQMIPTVVPQPLSVSQPQSSMQTPQQMMMMQPQLQSSTPQQMMMMQPQLQSSTPQQVMMMQPQGSSQPDAPINKSTDVDAPAATDGNMSFPQPDLNSNPTADGNMSFPQPEVNSQPEPVNLRQSITNPALYLVQHKPALSPDQTRISNNMKQTNLSRSSVRFNPKRLSTNV